MEVIFIIFTAVNSFICLVSIILNSLGMYLLRAAKPLSNSKLLLINLAASEIFNSVIQIIFSFVRTFPDEETIFILRKCSATSWHFFYAAMYLLTIDRLIAALFPMKYRVSATPKRLARAILAIWILVLVLGTSFFVSNVWFKFFERHMWVGFDVTFMVVCSATYGLIFVKIRSRTWFGNNKKFFKISSFIILSFVIFNLFPDIIFLLYSHGRRIVLESLCIVWFSRMVLDPMIYIFLQAELRSLLKTKLFKNKITEINSQQETAL